MSGFIQIAGVHDEAEAELLVGAGVDAIGFPFRLDHHAEDLTESAAKRIIARFPSSVRAILITYLNRSDQILELAGDLGVGGVQLHGPIPIVEALELKRRAPNLWLIKSLVIRPGEEPEAFSEMAAWGETADAFLTDTYDPETGASGATGKVHDWEISRRLADLSPKPLILAGGLNPENVGNAIEEVRSWGVDAHTGVEDSAGRKDSLRVKQFVERARRAFDQRDCARR